MITTTAKQYLMLLFLCETISVVIVFHISETILIFDIDGLRANLSSGSCAKQFLGFVYETTFGVRVRNNFGFGVRVRNNIDFLILWCLCANFSSGSCAKQFLGFVYETTFGVRVRNNFGTIIFGVRVRNKFCVKQH